MLKPSPRKDTDIVQRKRGNLYKAIKAEKLLASLWNVSAGLYLSCYSVLNPDAACSSTFTFLHFFQHSAHYKALLFWLQQSQNTELQQTAVLTPFIPEVPG